MIAHGLVTIVSEGERDMIIKIELNDGRSFEVELDKNLDGSFLLDAFVNIVEYKKKDKS